MGNFSKNNSRSAAITVYLIIVFVISFIIGLVQYPNVGLKQLFSEADKMLYHAKNEGRNQLVFGS